jgi:hypothetical protein
MDEDLPVACNDLDLCLRIRKLGYRNIVTPFADLWHAESASRGYSYDTPNSRQAALDELQFQKQYGDDLERDPSYNINLTLRGSAYALSRFPRDAPPPDAENAVRAFEDDKPAEPHSTFTG